MSIGQKVVEKLSSVKVFARDKGTFMSQVAHGDLWIQDVSLDGANNYCVEFHDYPLSVLVFVPFDIEEFGFYSLKIADATFRTRINNDPDARTSLLDGIEDMRQYCKSPLKILEPVRDHLLTIDKFPYVTFVTPLVEVDRMGENDEIVHNNFYELNVSASGVLTFEKYFKAYGTKKPSLKEVIPTEMVRSDIACLITDLSNALSGRYERKKEDSQDLF